MYFIQTAHRSRHPTFHPITATRQQLQGIHRNIRKQHQVKPEASTQFPAIRLPDSFHAPYVNIVLNVVVISNRILRRCMKESVRIGVLGDAIRCSGIVLRCNVTSNRYMIIRIIVITTRYIPSQMAGPSRYPPLRIWGC